MTGPPLKPYGVTSNNSLLHIEGCHSNRRTHPPSGVKRSTTNLPYLSNIDFQKTERSEGIGPGKSLSSGKTGTSNRKSPETEEVKGHSLYTMSFPLAPWVTKQQKTQRSRDRPTDEERYITGLKRIHIAGLKMNINCLPYPYSWRWVRKVFVFGQLIKKTNYVKIRCTSEKNSSHLFLDVLSVSLYLYGFYIRVLGLW